MVNRVNRVDSPSRLSRVGESSASHRRRSPTATAMAYRRWRRTTATTEGGARRQRRCSGGGEAVVRRRRRFPEAARITHERTEVKLPEALAASSGLRLRRGRWLRLRLDERNTMVALHTRDSQRLGSYQRFTKTAKTWLKCMAVFRLTLVCEHWWQAGVTSGCGGSGDLWW